MKTNTFFPKVKDVAHMGVISASGSSTVAEALDLMELHNHGDVVFRNADGGYSIFTVEGVMQFHQHRRDLGIPLQELATTALICVEGDASVLKILDKFDEAHCRYLGVLDEAGELVGIVSYTDVLASVDPALMIERKRLSEVLSKLRPEIVDHTAKVESVLALLEDLEDAVLIEQDGKLAGIVTTKDAIRIIKHRVEGSDPIGKHMTSPVLTIGLEETVKAAIEFLKVQHFKRAIVVDENGRVAGMLTQRELVDITYGRWAELMKLHAHELGELVSMLESSNQELKKESLTDPLTGVGNRRRFNHLIESEIGRYYRHGMTPFSVLLLDIDHFKQINDTHGHLAGDNVLKKLSARIFDMLRTSDEISRWGGEEFAVMLPTANLGNSAALAERIRTDIARMDFDGLNVTISIGAAEYCRGESMEDLMRRADQALYAAKQGGRNRVAVAD